MAEYGPVAAAIALGAGITLLVTVSPLVHVAYSNPHLHLALETAEGVGAAHLAYLFLGRFRTTGELRHLALTGSFGGISVVDVLFGALPIIALGTRPLGAVPWAAAGFRLAAIGTLCVAACADGRRAPKGRALSVFLVATTASVLAIVLLAAMGEMFLGELLNPSVPPETSGWPPIVGHPVVLGIQLLGLALYAVAAFKFTKASRREHLPLLRWLSAGSVLGAFARANYFLFPSLHSNWVYTGDLLRLGSYMFFAVGAALEIEAYLKDHATVAILEERRRMARELHDGLAQELTFIRSQIASMATGMPLPGMVGYVADAAERALEESRRTIDTLTTQGGPLDEALRTAAEDVTRRAGARVEVQVQAPAVAPAVVEALVRIVREAAGNAVRHGGADCVLVRLVSEGRELRLQVTDEGRGFVPDHVRGGFGLRSMRERVEALGGELVVDSQQGVGTTIEALVPLARFPNWRRRSRRQGRRRGPAEVDGAKALLPLLLEWLSESPDPDLGLKGSASEDSGSASST